MADEFEVFVPVRAWHILQAWFVRGDIYPNGALQGRVCLFGEHSDWAGSFRRFNSAIEPGVTIVCGTNHGLYARVSRHPSKLVLVRRCGGGVPAPSAAAVPVTPRLSPDTELHVG